MPVKIRAASSELMAELWHIWLMKTHGAAHGYPR
jgi:hypothetical protein